MISASHDSDVCPLPWPEQSTGCCSTRRILHRSGTAVVGRTECRPRDESFGPERVLDSPMFSLVRRGVFIAQSEGRRACIDTRSAIFHNPGEPFRAGHPGALGDLCTWFALSASALNQVLASVSPLSLDRAPRLFTRLSVPVGRRAFELHRSIIAMVESGRSPDRIAIDESAMELAAELLKPAEARSRPAHIRASTVRAHADLVEETKRVLSTRHGEKLTLESIASAVHSSPFNLCRIFRSQTGCSLHGYLTQVRLREALERLCGGVDDLGATAESVGFASHSHMCDVFRRELGVSPLQFVARVRSPRS